MVNKKAVKSSDWKFLAGLILSIVLVAVLVVAISLEGLPGVELATNTTTTVIGSIWYNGTFNEDTNYTLNISLNNTVLAISNSNITEINFTLPGGFIFQKGTNGTKQETQGFLAGSGNFSNTSTVLSWVNNTIAIAYNESNTSAYFWFDVNAPTPGHYNMSVRWRNGTTQGHENITIIVNDTTNITNANWTTSANDIYTNGSNLSATTIRANLTWSENGILGDINVTLYNSTHGVLNSSANPIVNATNGSRGYSFYVEFTNTTGLPDGTYYINVTTLNDSYGNNLDTWGTPILYRKITLDTTNPTVSSFSCTPDVDVNVGESVTCTCSGLDTMGTGVKSTVFNSTGYSTEAREITQTCKVTDYADNTATKTLTYTVYSSSAAGNGGSPGGGSSTATKTVVITDEQFEAGHATSLKANEQAKVKVSGTYHFVSVDTVTTSTVKITVSSDHLQEATLSIGDTRKFDVTDDGLYDISVTLDSITGGKADLTILSISEEVTVESEVAEEEAEEAAADVAEEEEEVVEEGSRIWIWIIVIVVVLIIAGVIVWKKKKGQL